jgi:hypothetical protein
VEYKVLVVKMHEDSPKNKHVHDNLDLLCDLELVLVCLASSWLGSDTYTN